MESTHKIGRRKTAIARIYMKPGTGAISVNSKDYTKYFPTIALQHAVIQAFSISNTKDQFDVSVNVMGGGFTGQAHAVRLAIASALCDVNLEHRPVLKKEGLLTRDPRMVERKKFGQKKACALVQFSKR